MKMQFTNDNRGVSEVIGAILVFGLVIALLAILQTQAIPAANEQVEFNHNQDVQSDLVGLQESTSRVSSQGNSESVKIRLGTTYPNRMLFFNPPNPAGTIRTVETQDAEIQNVTATDNTIQKYINGSISGLQTSRVEYQPEYNEYRNPPTTVLEYGTLYSDFGNQQQINNPGSIVDGNSISLTFFAGELSRTSGSTMSVEARPTSAPTRTVNVEPTEENMTIRLATRLSEEKWKQLLDDEPNVEGIRHDGESVVIALNGSETYSIEMAKLGVGSNTESPEPQYIVPTGGLGPSKVGIRANTLPFEVRDRYNNPVSGETVNISVSKGEFANGDQSTSATTNTEGGPNVRYSASEAGLVTVNVSFNGDPAAEPGSFNPNEDPADLQFRMAVDPSQDTQKPSINTDSSDITRRDYTVCGSSGLVASLGCTLDVNMVTIQYSQITVGYDITDNGPAGLDSMKIEVVNQSNTVRMTDQLGLSGSEANGFYRSPQIFIENGYFSENTPDELTITVTDKAGNKETKVYDVSNS